MMIDLTVQWFEPSYWAEDFAPNWPEAVGWYVYDGSQPVAGPFATKLEAAREMREMALMVA